MRRRRLSSLNTRGDTIVEVLIAIAVVSAVLGGAFASTSRSLRGSRLSQERGEAVKYTEGQVESLKSALAVPAKSNQIFTLTTDFCLDDTLTVVTNIADARCRKGQDGRYQLALRRTGSTFNATSRWSKVGGGNQETVTITYRAYQP